MYILLMKRMILKTSRNWPVKNTGRNSIFIFFCLFLFRMVLFLNKFTVFLQFIFSVRLSTSLLLLYLKYKYMHFFMHPLQKEYLLSGVFIIYDINIFFFPTKSYLTFFFVFCLYILSKIWMCNISIMSILYIKDFFVYFYQNHCYFVNCFKIKIVFNVQKKHF